jgi:APA family basic amino acid/polyamine antiporter
MSDTPPGTLRRGLGFVNLWSIGVGALIGGGIFTVIGPAVAQAGPALFVAFIIAGVVALLSTFSYAELASIWPYEGASYAYGKFAFSTINTDLGRLVGLLCAGLYFIAFGFAAGAVNLAFAGYFNYLVPGVPPGTIAPIVSVLITGLLLLGISVTGKVNTVLSIIQVLALIAIAIIAIFANPTGPLQYAQFLPNGWTGVFGATALIAFGQMQVEAILTVGEEARNPRRNLPLAQISALVTAVVLYIATGYGVVSAANPVDLAQSTAPLSLAMETVIPGAAAALIAIAALTATSTSTVGTLLGSSRMLFAAAREKAVPAIFGQVSTNTGAPTAAIVLAGVVALGTTFMAQGGYADAITIAVGAAVFANWFMMAIMNVALIVVRIKRPELRPWFRYPLNIKNIPVLAIVAAVAALWILTYLDTVPLILGASWVVLITIFYFVYSRSRWEYLSEEDMSRLEKQRTG